jgi:hypothetical protein
MPVIIDFKEFTPVRSYVKISNLVQNNFRISQRTFLRTNIYEIQISG